MRNLFLCCFKEDVLTHPWASLRPGASLAACKKWNIPEYVDRVTAFKLSASMVESQETDYRNY
jgi:hypothetical protein